MLLSSILSLCAVLCGTWNLKWFPSGRAEHRAPPNVEAATISGAAEHVRGELSSRRRVGEGVVLFFQELRDGTVFSNLVMRIGAPGMKMVSVSSFRERDNRLGWQQCAIASNLPVLDSGFAYWKRPRRIFPPRGYAYALLDGGDDGVIACFCVHLKSNYGATTEELRRSNREKREVCAEQLVALAKTIKTPDGRRVNKVLVGGDFNADSRSPRYGEERTAAIMIGGGFIDGWEGVPYRERITHSSSKRRAGSTLDYVYARGFSKCVLREVSPAVEVSDHRMAWFRYE